MTRALQLPDNEIHVGVRIFLFLYRIKISKRLLLGKVVVSEIENVKYFELFYCRKNKTCYIKLNLNRMSVSVNIILIFYKLT